MLQDAERAERLLMRHLERDAVLTSPHGHLTQAALSALTQMACSGHADPALGIRQACWPMLSHKLQHSMLGKAGSRQGAALHQSRCCIR